MFLPFFHVRRTASAWGRSLVLVEVTYTRKPVFVSNWLCDTRTLVWTGVNTRGMGTHATRTRVGTQRLGYCSCHCTFDTSTYGN